MKAYLVTQDVNRLIGRYMVSALVVAESEEGAKDEAVNACRPWLLEKGGGYQVDRSRLTAVPVEDLGRGVHALVTGFDVP